MKKIVLTLALVAGLTSFTRTVMAQSVISTYNVSMNSSVNNFLTFTPPPDNHIDFNFL